MAARRFTKAELESFVGSTVDDLVAPGIRLLFVGINPGLWTAAVNAHFARRGNRFWPALHLAGITPTRLDVSAGMPPDVASDLLRAGVGISNLVPYATARADELTAQQLAEGAQRLRKLVREVGPRVVAVLGKTAYAQAFGVRAVTQGRQPVDFEGAELWVLPNPSGLNAHDNVESLAIAYREAAVAAGLALSESRLPRA